MAADSRRPEERERTGLSGAEFAGLGFQFAATLLLFLFVGRWLDQKLGTEPWLLILGVFLGFALSLYSMQRRATASTRRRGPEER